MEFERKDTAKFVVERMKTIAILKDNNLIPKNPTGRKGKRTINKGSIGGDTLDPFGEQNYVKTKQRRKIGIKEIIRNNFDEEHSRFVTLTFDGERLGKENVANLDWTHKEFGKFIKRVNYRYDNFKYVATFARQQNGNWHYHMLCNFPPETTEREIKEIWGNGRVDKTAFQNTCHYENVIKYLLRNMDSSEDELKGRKGYLSSFNAKKNIRVCSWKEEDSEEYLHWNAVIVERGKESVKVLYKGKKATGIIKEEIDTKTGKILSDIIIGVELDENMKKQGYIKLNTRTEVYLSQGSNEDVFPPPQFAVPKPQKKKAKKRKAKKEK